MLWWNKMYDTLFAVQSPYFLFFFIARQRRSLLNDAICRWQSDAIKCTNVAQWRRRVRYKNRRKISISQNAILCTWARDKVRGTKWAREWKGRSGRAPFKCWWGIRGTRFQVAKSFQNATREHQTLILYAKRGERREWRMATGDWRLATGE